MRCGPHAPRSPRPLCVWVNCLANCYGFLTVEDPNGIVNAVIAPDVYAQYRNVIHSLFVVIDGVLQRGHGAINII